MTIFLQVISWTYHDFPIISPSKLTAYTDAAYGNDPRKRRSTTGFAICLADGTVVYRSKIQKVTALNSTEAELFAAVSTAKVVLYLRSILTDSSIEIFNRCVVVS